MKVNESRLATAAAAPLIDYEAIFVCAPVGMCVSENCIIRHGNDALAAMFGYCRDDLTGQSFQLFYPSKDEFSRADERLRAALASDGRYAEECIMRRAYGALFWCRVSGHALRPEQPLGACIWKLEDVGLFTAELTPRQREIAALLASGRSCRRIADETGLSPRTIEGYRALLMRKFGAATAVELVHKLTGMSSRLLS